MDNETWIIEYGHEIILKISEFGIENLTPKEHLVYCLWVADYSVRNAGDMESGLDIYPQFLNIGQNIASAMKLPKSSKLFTTEQSLLPELFYELFDEVCNEIRTQERCV